MVLWWLGTAAAKQWSKLGSHLKQLNLTFPSVSFRSGIRNDPAFFLVRARHGRVRLPGGVGLALNGDDKRSEVTLSTQMSVVSRMGRRGGHPSRSRSRR